MLALCPSHAGTFSPASVPNQSLISAREKVFLLLLTNPIVFPMFSRAREQRLGPCQCQLCSDTCGESLEQDPAPLPPAETGSEFIPRAQSGECGAGTPGRRRQLRASPLCPSVWCWQQSVPGLLSPQGC